MNRIKKIINSKTAPFIILFFIMFVITLLKSTNLGDDIFFADVLTKGSGPYPEVTTMTDYLSTRYKTWTSRVVIEFFLVLFTVKLPFLWKLIDPFMYVIIAYSIKRVFLKDKDDKLSWILIFLVLMIPVSVTKEAGSIATSVNYIWPIACGLVALIPIRKCIDEEKIKWFENFVYLPLAFYAVNSELVCACLLIVYLIFTIYLAIKKRLKPIIILTLILSIASMIFILTCPGNESRTIQEMERNYSNYNSLSVVEKLLIGIVSTMKYYFFNFNIIYFIFTTIMMVVIFKKYDDNILFKVIGAFPFIMRYSI